MLNLLDPTAGFSGENQADYDDVDPKTLKPDLITLYKSAKKVYGVLPGGYHYLHITKPGLSTSYDEEKAQENFVKKNF